MTGEKTQITINNTESDDERNSEGGLRFDTEDSAVYRAAVKSVIFGERGEL